MVSNRAEWYDMKWFVATLQGGFSVERYHQLTRFQNHRHSTKFYFSMTLFYGINNFSVEYEQTLQTSSSVRSVAVSGTYFGKYNGARIMTILTLSLYGFQGRNWTH